MRSAFEAGEAAWPGCRLSLAAFRERLDAAGIDDVQLRAQPDGLFLAVACAAGDVAAVAHFERAFFPKLGPQLARFALSADAEDELRQLLRIKLLTGPTPKIAEYRGNGPLGAWVRVCAVRLALDAKESEAAKARREEQEELTTIVALSVSPEIAVAKGEPQQLFQAALEEALAGLEPRDKTLLRMHFLDGMSVDEIGVVFRVHRATAARWLVAIRGRIFEQVSKRVALEMPSSSSEFRSLVRLVYSDVRLSIGRVLAGDAQR